MFIYIYTYTYIYARREESVCGTQFKLYGLMVIFFGFVLFYIDDWRNWTSTAQTNGSLLSCIPPALVNSSFPTPLLFHLPPRLARDEKGAGNREGEWWGKRRRDRGRGRELQNVEEEGRGGTTEERGKERGRGRRGRGEIWGIRRDGTRD